MDIQGSRYEENQVKQTLYSSDKGYFIYPKQSGW